MADIYVAHSTIHGFGVFCARDFASDEIIGDIEGPVVHKVNESVEDALANPDWVGIGHNTWVDPVPPYKFINHSCDPSVGISGDHTLVARRNLSKGEEITFDYSISEEDQRWHMNCHCNTPTCRHEIRSIQSLPEVTFTALLPHIGTYFQNIFHASR